MTAGVLAFGFPNPFDFVGDLASGLLLGPAGAIAGDAIQEAVGWLVEAILGALVELSVAVLGFFWDAAEPETGAAWFSGGESTPYGEMVVLAAPLLVVFLLAGVIQGVLKGDTAGMLRMALVRLPGAVLAMSVTVAVTDLLLQVTNDMSESVLDGFRDDVEATTQMLETVASTPGLAGQAQFLMIVFGLIGLFAAVVLVIELFVRAGLIYIVVALSPLIYAAAVWESMRGGVRKMGEIGLALIFSKFVIAVALALSGAAMTAAWSGHETATELATPEQAAAAATAGGEGMAQTVGILVGAIVMFGVAAFMPFVLFRLLPMAEGAMVAQGIKGGPLRAAQQGGNAAMMARHNPASAAMRSGGSGGGGAGAARGGSAAAGGAAVAAGPAAAAAAAAGAAKKVTANATKTMASAPETAAGGGGQSNRSGSRLPSAGGRSGPRPAPTASSTSSTPSRATSPRPGGPRP